MLPADSRVYCLVSSLLRHLSAMTSETLARAGIRGGAGGPEGDGELVGKAWRVVGVHEADINITPAPHPEEQPQNSNDPH